MKKIQPEIDRLNKAYQKDPQKAQQEMMALRKREGIGMMPKGCGIMLITYPILIAFFAVFRNLAAEKMVELSTLTDAAAIEDWFNTNSFLWVKNIWQPDVYFNFSEVWGLRTLWIIKDIDGYILPTLNDLPAILQSAFKGGFLNEVGANFDLSNFETFCNQVNEGLNVARGFVGSHGNGLYILPILAGVVQVFSFNLTSQQQQTSQNDPTAQSAASTGKFMKIFFPLMFVYFCLISSTALAIYWITSSLCQILANFVINKVLDAKENKKLLAE